jgi:hypothetical protein
MKAIVDYQKGSMGKIITTFDKGQLEEKKEKKNKD